MRGIVCALAGGVCWGFSGTCAQLLMSGYGVPSLWITCIRMAVAAVFFLAVVVVKERASLVAVFHDRRALMQIAAFAFGGVLLTQVSYLLAIQYVGAGIGTVFEQLGLVFVMFYVCLCGRRLPRGREAAGLVFALAGTVAICTKGNLGSLAIPPEGLAWGLVAALALATYTLMPVKPLQKYSAMLVTGLAMLFGGVAVNVVIQPWAMDVQLSAGALAALAAIVVVGTLGAYLLYLQGVKDAGPVRASLLCCVEPVAAMVLSVVWLGTPMTAWDYAGCVLIIIMVFLVTDRNKADAKPASKAADSLDYEGAESTESTPTLERAAE